MFPSNKPNYLKNQCQTFPWYFLIVSLVFTKSTKLLQIKISSCIAANQYESYSKFTLKTLRKEMFKCLVSQIIGWIIRHLCLVNQPTLFVPFCPFLPDQTSLSKIGRPLWTFPCTIAVAFRLTFTQRGISRFLRVAIANSG